MDTAVEENDSVYKILKYSYQKERYIKERSLMQKYIESLPTDVLKMKFHFITLVVFLQGP